MGQAAHLRFGVSFDGTWTELKTPGGNITGFQNFGTTFKYLAATNAPHELMLSVGLDVEWGGTGNARVGADSTSTLTPNLYFGKGASDLPDGSGWAQPFALTGVIGYAVPLEHEPRAPGVWLRAGIQLPLPRIARPRSRPALGVNELTPLVEVQLATPLAVSMPGTGTINPGVIWSGPRAAGTGGDDADQLRQRPQRGRGIPGPLVPRRYVPHSIGKPIW